MDRVIEHQEFIPSDGGKPSIRYYKSIVPRCKKTGKYESYKHKFRKITIGEYTLNVKMYI